MSNIFNKNLDDNKKDNGFERLAPESTAHPIKTYLTPNYTINGVDVQEFFIDESNQGVKFSDLIGLEKEIDLIKNEIFITNLEKEFRDSCNISNSKFILIYGVPGVGKSYFMEAIKSEFQDFNKDDDCRLINVKISSIVSSELNKTEKNICSVFEFAKQFEKSILFFDDIDLLVSSRLNDSTKSSWVTTFIRMINSLDKNKQTIVIGATCFPDLIDPAVLSRVDSKIALDLPNSQVIRAFIGDKIGSILENQSMLDMLVDRLSGYSMRDLKYFCEKLKESLFKDYMNQKNGTDFENYKIDNSKIEEALNEVKSSVKESDLNRILSFRKSDDC